MPVLIQRYLIREVAIHALAVAAVLVLLFASFSASRFMAQAANETYGMAMILQLVGLRTLIALETLLPLALYLGVVIGLGRLHSDNELIALQAAGFGEGRVLVAVIVLALPLALAVAWISIQWRPWAYDLSYRLQAEQDARPLAERLRADRFKGGDEVIHAAAVDAQAGRLEGVLVYRRDQGRRTVIRAQSATQPPAAGMEERMLVLHDGHAYRFDAEGDTWQQLRFTSLRLPLEEGGPAREYRRKAEPTLCLAASARPDDVAELQWRLSRPSATLLLALLAVPISRTAPRRGRYGRLLVGLVAYALFYNVGGIARTWVEQGVVGALPGLWWPQLLLAAVVVLTLHPPRRRHRR